MSLGSDAFARSPMTSHTGVTPFAPTVLPPLTAAIRYHDKHGDVLFRFVDDPEVPIDNSPTGCARLTNRRCRRRRMVSESVSH